MRAIWKGAVAFGLVNVPVKLYAATGETGVTLHQVHEKDGGRIHYRKVCSVDGEEVPAAEIAKGYETDGRMVVLTDQDLAELPLSTEREISVEEFVPAEQVDPIMLAKTYYLEPETTAAKPYALLREALRATERMAVVKVALRQREQMAVLRVRGDVICLQTLLWPDEIREADFPVLEAEVTVRPQEQAMAASLVESLAGEFDPSDFTDAYRGALEALIEGKVSAGATVQTPVADLGEQGEGGEVIDLLAALQRSIDKARAGKSTDGAREPAPREARGASAAATGTRRPRAKAPAAGAPAAKAPASKAAASTAPASKAAATKATGTKATPARKVGATTAS
uniref:non-homologous end joining protein Ku n=1 Tax=Actinotalea sp. TaxID=1872145 RepID=UPI003569FCCA